MSSRIARHPQAHRATAEQPRWELAALPAGVLGILLALCLVLPAA